MPPSARVPVLADPERGERGARGAAAGPQVPRQVFSDRPLRCAKRCCPLGIRWLRAFGYDEALVIRDLTHLSLYLSCLVSLCLTIMWISDVLTGDCWQPSKARAGDDNFGTCTYEVLGAIIFFGTLCDSIQMIGNYDNEHQELLARKKQLMQELRSEVNSALKKARDNIENLSNMLLSLYEEKANKHVEEYLDNVLPKLIRYLITAQQPAQAAANRTLLLRLSDLVGQLLAEPGQLAVAFCHHLQEAYQQLCDSTADLEGQLGVPQGGGPPEFWAEATRGCADLVDAAPRSPRPSPRPSPRGSTRGAVTVGKQTFQPVKNMVSFLQIFLDSHQLQGQAEEPVERHLDQLAGLGRPPWAGEPGGRRFSVLDAIFWSCLANQLRRLWILAVLLIHVPCLCLCLARVRELDAIIQIMEDIRKLEDIREVIRNFERRLRVDEERTVVMEAITDRMMMPLELVNQLRSHIFQRHHSQDAAVMREAALSLVDCLEFGRQEFGPAAHWVDLPAQEQRVRVQTVKDDVEALSKRNFTRKPEMGDVVAMPEISSASSSSFVAHSDSRASLDGARRNSSRASVRNLSPPLQPGARSSKNLGDIPLLQLPLPGGHPR